uniref:Uncharacterized protein n=1 Tax=Rhizophora mucronata TaxID=61149 RepID=A0A2P2JAI8_RHIMU
MSDEDEWVKLAMTDDSVIVRLLLKLSEAPPVAQQPQQPVVDSGAATLRVQWSVRQRRSRCVPRKKGDTTRASPTTPLSWSGATATSFSGGATAAAADGFEESSLAAKPVDTARSKVTVASETSTVKRSRKKKTLAELREEESLLLKESGNLQNELQALRFNVDKVRARNECLKRLKLDLLQRQTPSLGTVSVKSEEVDLVQSQQIKAASDHTCSVIPISAACNECEPYPPHAVGSVESAFLLPDLNLPVEDDSSPEVLYGTS